MKALAPDRTKVPRPDLVRPPVVVPVMGALMVSESLVVSTRTMRSAAEPVVRPTVPLIVAVAPPETSTLGVVTSALAARLRVERPLKSRPETVTADDCVTAPLAALMRFAREAVRLAPPPTVFVRPASPAQLIARTKPAASLTAKSAVLTMVVGKAEAKKEVAAPPTNVSPV